MSRARRSFPPALLDSLRAMTVQETLDRLGLYWKRDPDFVPVKDKTTVRLNVSIGGGGVELLGVVCGRGRNPTLRLWPTIFSGKIDVFPGDRRSRLISSMTSVAPA